MKQRQLGQQSLSRFQLENFDKCNKPDCLDVCQNSDDLWCCGEIYRWN